MNTLIWTLHCASVSSSPSAFDNWSGFTGHACVCVSTWLHPRSFQATHCDNSAWLKCAGGDSSAVGWPDRHLNWFWQSAVWAIDQQWVQRRGSQLKAGSFVVFSSYFWGAAGETQKKMKHSPKMALRKSLYKTKRKNLCMDSRNAFVYRSVHGLFSKNSTFLFYAPIFLVGVFYVVSCFKWPFVFLFHRIRHQSNGRSDLVDLNTAQTH